MKKTSLMKTLLCLLLSATPLSLVHAADLMDVYRQALENDPTFKAAYSTFMSQSEAVPQALAALLPQVIATAGVGRNSQEVDAGAFRVNQTYDADQWKISASQAIFNYQSWSQVQQARASVKAAHATFNNAAQDLMLRTTNAYLQLLYSRDTLSFADAKKRANKRQLDQAQQRFNVGLDAITSVYEAQAAYDQSVAQVISAQNNLVNQNENLSKLTNHIYEQISPLRDSKIPLIKPEPNRVSEWVSAGIKQNYNLFAAKYNLQAARENIKAQSAGNWPTLALQGTSSRVDYGNNNNVASASSGSVNPNNFINSVFVPTKQATSNVALTLNFPVFQGGLIASKTRQAKYEFQSSSEQLEKTYRDVVVNSRIAFNTIVDGISKVKADRQTIISQTNSLGSVAAQYEVGTRTMTDVVLAQQRLFEAQEQLASDQYQLINSILNLKYLAGSLNVNDIGEVNSWLATTRINGLPPQFAMNTRS